MSKKRRTSVGYTDPLLLKPLQLLHAGLDLGPLRLERRSDTRKIENQVVADVNARVAALWQHYEIKPGHWKTLALALAFDHVAGFSTAPPKKRKIVEADWHLFMLYDFVVNKKANTDLSVSSICRGLPSDPDFKTRFPSLRNAKKERLQNLFSLAEAKGAAEGHGSRTTPSPMFRRFAEGGFRQRSDK